MGCYMPIIPNYPSHPYLAMGERSGMTASQGSVEESKGSVNNEQKSPRGLAARATRMRRKTLSARAFRDMVPRRQITMPRSLSARSTFLSHGSSRSTRLLDDLMDLSWYSAWLAAQRQHMPPVLGEIHVEGQPLSQTAAFDRLFELVREYAAENRGFSIDDLIEAQQESRVLGEGTELNTLRLLMFAMLGWQSMVYLPGLNVCDRSYLAIHHDSNEPDSKLVFDKYQVRSELCHRPVWVLLKCFGNLLPARSSDLPEPEAVTNSKAAASWTPLYPSDLNAYLLHTLLGVRFRWVDSLALHLDFDKSSRTLSLFAFPSVCVSQLRLRRGAVFAFSSTETDGIDPRADEEDIAHMLEEVLLSFRLLFGQSKKSRQFFRRIFDTAQLPFSQPDTLLEVLCSQKLAPQQQFENNNVVTIDRHVYYAARDFPVLYERIQLLTMELSGTRPKSVSGLLRDRRDTLQFWTFWLVAIFGALSVTLSSIQVAMQAVQLVQEMKD